MAEEVWVEILGNKYSIHQSKWPQFESKYIINDQSIIIVQINGKVRGQLVDIKSRETDKSNIEKLAKKDTRVAKFLKDKKIKKVIYVPGKIINFFNFLVFQKLCNSCVFFGQLFYITFVRFPTFNIY